MSESFLAIDFETANPSRDSACAIGLVRVKNGKIVQKQARLIRPPSKYFTFTSIHGITWADVANESTFEEIWDDIFPLFEDIDFIVAHNAKFDESVLKACCQRYGIIIPRIPFYCTVKLARQHWGIYPTKLPNVCRQLNIDLDHHNAISDALACAQIMIAAQNSESSVVTRADFY